MDFNGLSFGIDIANYLYKPRESSVDFKDRDVHERESHILYLNWPHQRE